MIPICGRRSNAGEEIWDCMYYLIALANCYDIDLEKTIAEKEAINNKKYNTGIAFEQNR